MTSTEIARRPTLDDVARRAGVSTPTVSKVLNGHGDVSAGTRSRVQEAIAAVRYVPRSSHRGPVSRTVEFMVDRLSTLHGAAVLEGIALAAEQLDVDIAVSRFQRDGTDGRPLPPRDWARRLARGGCVGAIVLTASLGPEHLAALARERIPLVVVDPLDRTNPEVPSVGSTNWAGGYTAAEHLLALGHRRIGVIGGRPESVAAATRVHGVRAACAAAGVPLAEDLVTFAGFGHDAGMAVAERWLGRPDRPTAVIAANDTQAIGVIDVAGQLGLRVPGDLSVVGYDDTTLASWSVPALTTVRQPLAEIGRVALRSVLAMAQGREPDASHVELATELVVRASTAPPREDPTA